MADSNSVELQIRAKNLTQDAFNAVQSALKALEETSHETTSEGSTDFGKWFETITGGVAAGELLQESLLKALSIGKELAVGIVDLGVRGGKVADVEEAFNRLAGSEQRATDILTALRAGTKGTVDDMLLMQTANKALSDGAKLSADDFQTMAAGARLLAKQSGGDTASALETLNQAMATGRTRALNLIGVHVDSDAALAHYSQTIHKSVDDFTDQDKVAATSAAVMLQLRDRVKEAGDQELSFGEQIATVKTKVANFEDELGKAIAQSPVLAAGMTAAGNAIEAALGGKQQAAIGGIVHTIEYIAVGAVDLADKGVVALKFFGDAWFGLQTLVDKVTLGFIDDSLRMLLSVEGIVAALASVPGAGAAFGLVDKDLQKAILSGASLEATLTNGFNKTIASAATFDTALDGTHKVLSATENAMLLAAAAGDKLKTSVTGAGTGAGAAFSKPNKDLESFTKDLEKLAKEYDAYAAKTSALDAAQKFGAEFDAAAVKASGFGTTIDALSTHAGDDAAKVAASLRGMISDSLTAKIHEGIGSILEALDKLPGQAGKAYGELVTQAQAAERKLAEMSMSATALAKSQADTEYQAEVDRINKTGAASTDAGIEALAAAKALHDHEIDLANGTADTIEERMRKQGVFVQGELDDQAAAAKRDYEQMLKDGTYTADELAAAGSHMVASAIAAGHGLRLAIEDDLSKIGASVLTTFASGGSVGQSLQSGAVGLGSDISKSLLSGTVKDLTKNSPALGHALGEMAGPLGGAAVTLGLDVGKKLWDSLFGTAGRDAVNTFIGTIAGGYAGLQAQLAQLGPQGQQLWVNLTQGVGKNDAAGAAKAIQAVQAALGQLNTDVQKYALTWKDLSDPAKLSAGFQASATALLSTFKELQAAGYSDGAIARQMGGDLNQLITDALTTGQKVPAALEPMLETFIRGGGLTDDLKNKLLGLTSAAAPSFANVQAAAQALGVNLDTLGPKVDQLRFTDELDADAKQLKVLQDAGADMGAVYDQMKGKMQDYVTKALQEGIQLPESIKPFIDQMISAGDLTDDLGNKLTDDSKLTWAKSLSDDVEDLVTEMKDLVSTIRDGVGGALDDVGNRHYSPTITPRVENPDGTPATTGDDSGLPQHDDGAYIRRDHVAMVHAGEMIGDQTFFGPMIRSAIIGALGGSGVGTDGGAIAVAPIMLDGQKLADVLVRRIPSSVRRFGVKQ